MLKWSIIPYDGEFPQPIVTAHGQYHNRKGFIVRVEDADGSFGVGDVAPLPGFSRESLPDALAQWREISKPMADFEIPANIEDMTSSFVTSDVSQELFPSVRFGLETALADCASRQEGLPFAQWLDLAARSGIEVNALLREQDVDRLQNEFDNRLTEGFSCFKIKVGVQSVDEDVARLQALRDRSGDAELRPDANAGWTLDQLTDACRRLAGSDLEFIEQPLPVGVARSALRITHEHGIRLALDEEVTSFTVGQRLLDEEECDVLVVKPMTVGGLTGCLELALTARECGKQVVFTSAWESDVGVAATVHLTAACGDVAPAAGVSTAGMIADGLVSPPLTIDRGRIEIGSDAGLGLTVVEPERNQT